MKICVLGLGYIGLPTSAIFSAVGVDVIGVDVNASVVDALNKGETHIEEPGLKEIIKKAVYNKKFSAQTECEHADAFIVSVPTPHKDDLSCDLTYVIDAINKLLPHVIKGNTVIVESTIAPKTMDDHIKPIFELAGYAVGKDIYLAHCPERVLPGNILYELINNNRIVGGITPECSDKAAGIYSLVVKGEIIKTEAKTAEMSKCFENTYRDINIAIANELAQICGELDINCLDVIKMANKHPRVNILSPGPGVGGHCLAIDPYFIYTKTPEKAKLIKLARDINISMPEFVAERAASYIKGIHNPKIAAFGVAYKGDTDDSRESPAIEVINILRERKYNVVIHDTHVAEKDYVDFETAIENADLILILTNHSEYKTLDHKYIAQKMRTPIMYDTRNYIEGQPDSGLKMVNFGKFNL